MMFCWKANVSEISTLYSSKRNLCHIYQFSVQLIHYSHCSKLYGWKTGKFYLCRLAFCAPMEQPVSSSSSLPIVHDLLPDLSNQTKSSIWLPQLFFGDDWILHIQLLNNKFHGLSPPGGQHSLLFDQGFPNNARLQRHLANWNAIWWYFVLMRLYLAMLLILSIVHPKL